MTRQEIFDRVKAHLLAQGAPAMLTAPDGEQFCAYLAEDGKRCAVGCLIPDGHPGLEVRGGVTDLIDLYPDLAELWGLWGPDNAGLNLLLDLQRLHDNWPPDDWSNKLNEVAAVHGLAFEP